MIINKQLISIMNAILILVKKDEDGHDVLATIRKSAFLIDLSNTMLP